MSTQSDRELLELAANASGRAWHWDGGVFVLDDTLPEECSAWYPLTDDGDALRLAVRLGISILYNIVRIEASTIKLTLSRVFIHEECIHQDNAVATRRAIVRAAAEIGRQS